MICKACQQENDDDARFCKACGQYFARPNVQEQFGSGASWFDRAGQRPIFGYRLGPQRVAVLLVAGIVSTASIILSTIFAAYGNRKSDGFHHQTNAPPTRSVQNNSWQPTKLVPKPSPSQSVPTEEQEPPVIISFRETMARLGPCRVWLLHWSTRAAQHVEINGEEHPASGDWIVRTPGTYRLTAIGLHGTSVTKQVLIPRYTPCS